MNAARVLESGIRGVHLLFENDLIAEAFRQEVGGVKQMVQARFVEVESAVTHLLELPTVADGRAFIEGLPRELQHVLVLLYFEWLHDRLRRHPTLH